MLNEQLFNTAGAVASAEAYALHGLVAKLADRHYKLHSDDGEARKGYLEHDPNLIQPPDNPIPNPKFRARRADRHSVPRSVARRRIGKPRANFVGIA